MSTFEEDSHLVRLLLQWSSLNKYYHLEQMTIFQWAIFSEIQKRASSTHRTGAIMELKNPLSWSLKTWKKNLSNDCVRSLYTGNTTILCSAKLI